MSTEEQRELTDEQAARIADQLAKAMFKNLAEQVGSSILKRILWIVLALIFISAYSVGLIKLPIPKP